MAYFTSLKRFGNFVQYFAPKIFETTVSERVFGATQSRLINTTVSRCKYYVKPNYLKRWARRDKKRRDLFAKHESTRGRLRMISKCDILPNELRKQASSELAELPRDSCITRVRNRCVLTDRGRGIVGRFRVSRIMFKEFAEKGLISGVQRSQWFCTYPL